MKRPFAIAIAATLLTPIAASVPASAQDVGTFTREALQADIQAFLTSREMARTRTSADNGDPYSIVKIVDALDAKYSGNSMVLNEIKVRYLVVAMSQGYGPAFQRMGEMVRLGQLPEGGPMDAIGFFEKGAEAGDADSAISYFKMARNLRVCSICEQGERGTETKLIEQPSKGSGYRLSICGSVRGSKTARSALTLSKRWRWSKRLSVFLRRTASRTIGMSSHSSPTPTSTA